MGMILSYHQAFRLHRFRGGDSLSRPYKMPWQSFCSLFSRVEEVLLKHGIRIPTPRWEDNEILSHRERRSSLLYFGEGIG